MQVYLLFDCLAAFTLWQILSV